MSKYGEDVQKKCVEAAKTGKPLAEIARELGPNPKAIQRYCAAAGVTLPKREKKAKAEKKEAPKEAAPATK